MTESDLAKRLIQSARKQHDLMTSILQTVEQARRDSEEELRIAEMNFGILYGQLATKDPAGE